jgi:hypothetical protein
MASSDWASLTPIRSDMLKPVLEQISGLTSKDLKQHKVWKQLADLAKKTTLTRIEAHPSGVYETGAGKFEAVATVYLTLGYDKQKSYSNSFPAHIAGSFDDAGRVKVNSISVDTSSLA